MDEYLPRVERVFVRADEYLPHVVERVFVRRCIFASQTEHEATEYDYLFVFEFVRGYIRTRYLVWYYTTAGIFFQLLLLRPTIMGTF